MVRAAALGLLFLAGAAQAQEADPWQPYRTADERLWSTTTAHGSLFYVLPSEVEGRQFGRVLWLRGEHAEDRTLPYRRSLMQVYYDCRVVSQFEIR